MGQGVYGATATIRVKVARSSHKFGLRPHVLSVAAERMLRDGQHGLHFTCYRPLSYDALENLWHCVTCGHSISGEVVHARSVT